MIKTIALALSLLAGSSTFSFSQEAPTAECVSGVSVDAILQNNGKADRTLNNVEAHQFLSAFISTLKGLGQNPNTELPEFDQILLFVKGEGVFAVATKGDCAVAVARIPMALFAKAWEAYEAMGTNATNPPASAPGFRS